MNSTGKIAISWIVSATICLTGYYYARNWARDQKVVSIKIRQDLNEEFGVERFREQARLNALTKDN